MHFFKKGHATSCGAPQNPCSCPRLYVFTGLLAVLAGGIQVMFGYWSSLALLSDGLHAGADGAADFLVAIIAIHVLRNPHLEQVLEDGGRKVVALMLAASAAWVVWEAFDRALIGTNAVVPWILALGGIGGASVDAYRLYLLRRAQEMAPNGMRRGLIAHARSDMYRSIIAATVGSILVGGELVVKTVRFESAISYLDLILSFGLSLYMFYLAKGIWCGEHTHVHTREDCGHPPH